jgi:hypothetical protein
MARCLHLAFGRETLDPARREFRGVSDIHVAGISANHGTRRAENAYMRGALSRMCGEGRDIPDIETRTREQ